jgi:hypothetical protein
MLHPSHKFKSESHVDSHIKSVINNHDAESHPLSEFFCSVVEWLFELGNGVKLKLRRVVRVEHHYLTTKVLWERFSNKDPLLHSRVFMN